MTKFNKAKSPDAMVPVTIYCTPRQREGLAALVEATKAPASVFVRQGVDMLLARENGTSWGQLAWRFR